MFAMRFYPSEIIDQHVKHRPEGYYSLLIQKGTPLFDQRGAMRGVLLTEAEHSALASKYGNADLTKPKPRGGPGTELKALLKYMGITSSPNCSCHARAAKMDEQGTAWCKENQGEVVSWLQEEAARRRLPFSRFAARKLVQIAIARAERKAAKTKASEA